MQHKTTWTKRAWALRVSCVALALVAAPVGVAAQDKPREASLTRAQQDQLREATRLALEERWSDALPLYEKLVSEVSAGILHLNHGRVLQKLGDCDGALAAFAKVNGSPRYPGVDRAQVLARLEGYREGLKAECPGRVKVTCAFPEMTVLVDNKEIPCADAELTLKAGAREVEGRFFDQRVSTYVGVKGTETVTASLTPERPQYLAAGRVLIGLDRAKDAVRVLNEALKLKKTQQAYVYLSEALIAQGRCSSAWSSIRSAMTATPSAEMSGLEVKSAVSDLEALLREECGERVQVRCKPESMRVRFDGGLAESCAVRDFFLAPGPHTLEAEVLGALGEPTRRFRREVVVEAGGLNNVVDVVVDDGLSAVTVWGLVGVGVGGGFLGGALLVDSLSLGPKLARYEEANTRFRDAPGLVSQRDAIENNQLAVQVLLYSGAALMVAGTTAIVLEALDDDDVVLAPEEEIVSQPLRVVPWVGAGAAGEGQAGVVVGGAW